MSLIETLHSRNSHARLVAPAPGGDELNLILKAGLRAPDHGRLRPWHFVIVEGEQRTQLGEVFEQSLLLANPDATEAERSKARCAPMRAPLLIAGLLKPIEHPKVPRVEQAVTVGCALHGMLLAADALGYGGMWRTGGYARDPLVIAELGGQPGDEIIGFLYLGTRDGDSKALVEESIADHVTWLGNNGV